MAQPWPADTTLCVMNVVDTRRLEIAQTLIENAKSRAQSLMKSAVDKLISSGQKLIFGGSVGNPEVADPKYAKQWEADLIMLGSDGPKQVSQFFRANVDQTVLRTSPCSVAIVRSGPAHPARGTRILLATDGSAGAAAAVYLVGSGLEAKALIADSPKNGQFLGTSHPSNSKDEKTSSTTA